MSAHGMEMLRGLLNTTAGARADSRAYVLAGLLSEALRLTTEGDFEALGCSIRAALSAYEAIRAEPEAAAPVGYDTIHGFMARSMPRVLESLYDVVAAVEEEEAELDALCEKRGVRPVRVAAPRAIIEAGGDVTCMAYPLAILQDRYREAAW